MLFFYLEVLFLYRYFINVVILLSLKSTEKILVRSTTANLKFYFGLGTLEHIFVALFSNTRQF